MKRSLAIIALSFCAAAARAQLTTDQVPQGRIVPASDQLRQEIEDSRYHFGGLHVQPILALRDFGYTGNVFGVGEEETADWRATFGAGARAILPAGRKVYLRLYGVPEYTWYRKLADRRAYGGDFGGALYVLFNKLPMEFGANQQRRVQSVSSEEERSVLTTRNNAFARFELDLLPRLSLFGEAEVSQPRYSVTTLDRLNGGEDLERLERNDAAARAGIRYNFRPYLSFGVAQESTRSRFLRNSLDDNHTHATMFLVKYDLPRTYMNAAIAMRTGEGETLSRFPKFSGSTGSYSIMRMLGAPVRAELTGHRHLTYSIFDRNSYFLETRNGLSLDFIPGNRTAVRVLGEVGKNDYPVAAGGTLTKRSDDALTIGGGFAFRIHRKIVLATLATSTRYDSNISAFDRTIVRVITSLSFGGGDLFQ